MRDAYQIVRRPLVTEKGTGMAEKSNSYTFEVAADANKVEIRKAIEKLFDVRVVSVNTMLRKGKVKGQGFRSWARPDRKRAIVKLAPGQAIEFI
jgi:large subunit ribosomal protein L23